jgi:AraC-like DNA-binding protein
MSGISRFIRSATLYGYKELAQTLGLDIAALLNQVGLSGTVFDEPDHPIRLDAACHLLELSAQHSGLENFGLRLAARRRLANLGAVSVVLREEPTGLAALEALSRFQQLVNPSLSTRIDRFNDVVVIHQELLADASMPVRQSMEMAVGVMHGILQELMGTDWRALRVCFTHRPPKDAGQHRALLRCTLSFNAEFNGIVCDRDSLETQLPGRDAKLAQFAQIPLDRALARMREHRFESVRQLVVVLLAQGRCTADQVALRLGVDRRTVHRQLALESESFSAILQSIRKDLVAHQLRDSDRSIIEIAQLLGFGSSSAFAHWFKKHHGCSVSQWRRMQ